MPLNRCNTGVYSKKDVINVVHQNIQGFASKELEIDLFLQCSDIHIFCASEHWLKGHEFMFNFKNHNVVSSFYRKTANRGGSLIMVKHNIKSKERKDIVDMSIERQIELSCVELERFIIVCVYRPPSADYSLFETVMDEVLTSVFNSNKCIIVCGDFNVNLLEKSPMCVRLVNTFKSFDLVNLFCEPTRITATSATCIDNIFSNKAGVHKSIINSLSSDHCGQQASFSGRSEECPPDYMCRPMTEKRLDTFSQNIAKRLSYLSFPRENPDDMCSALFNCIKEEFDLCFIPKKTQGKSKMNFSEWATPDIHERRRRLYDLYNLRTTDKRPDFLEYVKNYSKSFKNICTTAKADYLSKKIQSSGDKVKTVWQVINNETGKNKIRDPHFSLRINDTLISSDFDVADHFERFFTDIPVDTTKSLDSSPEIAESLLKNSLAECTENLRFTCVTPSIIIKTFRSLNLKKTEDLWGLSVKVLHSIIELISPHLADIFNKSIDTGVFPDLMKHSKIIPLFKSGTKTDPTNFRPISILPALSKIFEKLILNQLLSHFNRNNLLNRNQFGFTKGRSTTDAGVVLLKHIFEAWEKAQDAIGVFCDLSKAFDCVDHDNLIRKMKHYGIKHRALDLITSYLSNRTQRVVINGTQSAGSTVALGVPQGSILGPFLFLLYINDLPKLIQDRYDIVLFADDTSLIFKVDRKENDINTINDALSTIVKWFTANNLLLNAKKTKCIKFTLPNVKQISNEKLKLKGDFLEFEDSTVFLGITLDAKLQWHAHIAKLAGKLSSAAYAVRRIRQLTNVETAKLVYYSYFHSVMSYGILLWGKAADIQTIFVLQKRAVRAIYKLKARASLREKFKEANILTVTSQYILENIMYVRKNLHEFKLNSDIHNYNTRSKNKLAVTACRLRKVSTSFVGNCIRFYNKIPIDVVDLPFNKFKLQVKSHLMSKAYYTLNEFLDDKNAFKPVL